ncbi:hypothetical protein [Virgisporangium ochraceum]|uniref:Uncharacterized protein n=1 Tax=Virgisporangium ochraceum TaxID=65505 RepID=A0A8J3ZUW3_9ACTN|nr:hypothetical protein [Virgisporangium ochraceum]GIJ70096.1 hypothetical protein Voc01_050130 [Virgisporangium ochraceum]
MAFDSRPRPVRRSARRRVPLLTALALLVMAAGLWFAGAASAPVPAPRLHAAEARVAAAEAAHADEPAPAEEPPPAVPAAGAVEAAAPVTGPLAAVQVAIAPAVAGPRAPPHS